MINRHFNPYSVLVDTSSRTVLVLNAKVLTKFTRQFVREGLWQHFGISDPSHGRYRFIEAARHWPFAPVPVYADLLLRPRRYRAYAFVRNPYARIASAWRSKLHDPQMEIASGLRRDYPPSMLRGGELVRIRRYASEHGLPGSAPETLIPFPVFVDYLASQKAGRRNVHWDLQTSVLQTQHFAFSEVFRIEDSLVTGFETVFTRVGFERAWVRHKLTKPVNASSRSLEPLYTPDLAERVYALYRPDFDAFGYDPESWRELDSPGGSDLLAATALDGL
jgi:hypothetical protein